MINPNFSAFSIEQNDAVTTIRFQRSQLTESLVTDIIGHIEMFD